MRRSDRGVVALVVAVRAFGCRGGGDGPPTIDARIEGFSRDCASAAEAWYVLRAGAGDYAILEADKRTLDTKKGLERCKTGGARDGCCEEARRTRVRIGGVGLVKLCDPLFRELEAAGCANVARDP